MPTFAEFQALYDATYWAWDATDKGYYVFSPDATHTAGTRVSSIPGDLSKAGALLFFPAAGGGDSLNISGTYGFYWSFYWSSNFWSSSTSIYSSDYYYPHEAYGLCIEVGDVYPQLGGRWLGFPVRPLSD